MEKEVQILILGVCLSCMCYVMGELGFFVILNVQKPHLKSVCMHKAMVKMCVCKSRDCSFINEALVRSCVVRKTAF